tara:strand:+ start:3268 stop:3690 length:423 start_codon:yes stop_codon:yes gene_type:complete
MNHVSLSEEEQQTVSRVYSDFQEDNQKAHDQARKSIAEEFDIEESEAETHPDMESKFETIRNSMNNSDIVSVDPNTGEPGKATPRPKFAANMAQAKRPPPQGVGLDAGEIEQLLTTNGLTVLQSASDYTQGVITFVVTKQ